MPKQVAQVPVLQFTPDQPASQRQPPLEQVPCPLHTCANSNTNKERGARNNTGDYACSEKLQYLLVDSACARGAVQGDAVGPAREGVCASWAGSALLIPHCRRRCHGHTWLAARDGIAHGIAHGIAVAAKVARVITGGGVGCAGLALRTIPAFRLRCGAWGNGDLGIGAVNANIL